VHEVLSKAAVDPLDVVGLWVDFTACTMLPTLADGTRLCLVPDFRPDFRPDPMPG
jgi:L-ribulokinase